MQKKHLLILVSLFLLVSTSEFLWVESLAGKEDLFEVETEFGSEFEEKSESGAVKFKLVDFGLDCALFASQVIDLNTPFHKQGEHSSNRTKVSSDLKLYLLYCQIRRHC